MIRGRGSCLPLIPVLLALAAAGLAGCGDARTPPPYLARAATPIGFSRASFPADGITFRAPTNWALTSGQPPQVATVHDAQATLAIWRYPRVQPLPVSRSQLQGVIPGLLRAIRARDPHFRLIVAAPTTLAGSPAVQVTGFETIAGQPRRVRSVHVFHAGTELVFDAFAPPADFARVDRLAFSPVLRSLRLR